MKAGTHPVSKTCQSTDKQYTRTDFEHNKTMDCGRAYSCVDAGRSRYFNILTFLISGRNNLDIKN